MLTDVTKLQTTSQADNVSGTILFYQICNTENGVCPHSNMAAETRKRSIVVWSASDVYLVCVKFSGTKNSADYEKHGENF